MLSALGIQLRTHIYVVEFDTECSHLLRQNVIGPKKSNIQFFPSGERFIEHLSKTHFRKNDLVIVFLGYNFFDDYNHALMNGIEVLESIKHIDKNIEVVLMANEDEQEYGAYVMKLGAHAFICKDDSLAARINNIILYLSGNRNLKIRYEALKTSFIVWIVVFALTLVSFLIQKLL